MTSHRFILGTAGHVDHGKSKLVTCLTGWDTDRLKEEKERGISIELGFAPLSLDGDTLIGVVDVPGHERFIKNMVAGAGGIDLAMLVVAADEGVMPQTREHLEVLSSLAVAHGVVVITKADLAPEDTRAIVRQEVAELVEGTFLEGSPVVETSVVTRDGIENLKEKLRRIVQKIPDRDTGGPFRLAVDRAFHMEGIGVVVTGSCYSGKVSVGDMLHVLPAEKTIRVREIQSFGQKRADGHAGERLAIALHGVKPGGVVRGDMVVTPSHFSVSHMVDARIHLARYAKFELKTRERVRVHHGAREVLGRVVLLDAERLRSGEQCLAQLRLEEPIVAAEGDYVVLRKYSPSAVMGGGRIVEPRARKHRANDRGAVDQLKIMEHGDSADRLIGQLHTAGIAGLKADAVDRPTLDGLVEAGRAVVVDRIAFEREALLGLREKTLKLAAEFARTHPLRYGIDKEELRERLRFPHGAPTFNRVLEMVAEWGGVFVRGNLVRTGTDSVELSGTAARAIAALESHIREAGFLCRRQTDLLVDWNGDFELSEALQFLKDGGRVHKIGADLYMHNDALAACLARLRKWFATQSSVGVPEFKELLGVTRKQAVPLLEYLDDSRYTTRRENVRVAGPRLTQPSE